MGMKFEDIGLSKLTEYSLMLAKKISESGYVPDHVLYVERVGLFLGHDIATYFNCSISGICSSRSGSSVKSKAKILLRYLPRAATHFLRNLELKSNIHGVKKERNVYIENVFPPKGKNLLIVDDAVDTGFSLKAVCDFLILKGYEKVNLKTAVITTTGNHTVCRPDFSLFEQVNLAFPWSYDSREYNETWKVYATLKAKVL